MALGGLIGQIFEAANEHSPVILTGFAVAGVIATAVLTARAVPKALKAIEEEEATRKEIAEERAKNEVKVLNKDYQEVYNDIYEPVSKKDRIKIGFKYFVPPIICGAVTIGCVVGAQKINSIRQAAMAASYELLRTTHDEYRMHVREELGKKRTEELEKELHDKKAEKILQEKPLSDREIEKLDVEAGAAIFVDGRCTGHRFVSTYEQVNKAIDEIELMLSSESGGGGMDFVSIPTFLQLAGDYNDFAVGCENLGFLAHPFARRLDKNTIYEPRKGVHRGHDVTLVYLNYGEPDDRVF